MARDSGLCHATGQEEHVGSSSVKLREKIGEQEDMETRPTAEVERTHEEGERERNDGDDRVKENQWRRSMVELRETGSGKDRGRRQSHCLN